MHRQILATALTIGLALGAAAPFASTIKSLDRDDVAAAGAVSESTPSSKLPEPHTDGGQIVGMPNAMPTVFTESTTQVAMIQTLPAASTASVSVGATATPTAVASASTAGAVPSSTAPAVIRSLAPAAARNQAMSSISFSDATMGDPANVDTATAQADAAAVLAMQH